MKNINNRACVVTGAASGIGRALALELAKRGAKLAISDVNMEGLEETVELIGGSAEVHCAELDVADRAAFKAYGEDVIERFGAVHVVINNAGVGLRATVEDMEYDDFEWLMGINFWGVVHGTKTFLPIMKEQDWGHIINISSLFGIIGVPTQSAYNAAKFAVRGFTESLRQELLAEGSLVSVTSVHPGGIKTNIANSSRIRPMSQFEEKADTLEQFNKLLARTTSDSAAKAILATLGGSGGRVLVGVDAKLIDLAQRLMPQWYQRAGVRAFKQNLK